MKKILFLLTLILFISTTLWSQTAKYSNEFLSLGIGARGLGMGNAMTAISDDITSAYWNPAGLSRMKKNYQLSLMHAEYFAGIAKYDYGAIGYKIDERSTVAFSYIRFGVDNIMNTTELIDNQGNIDYDRITYFSAADNAFLLSYAYNFEKVKGLALGGNVKVIHRKIGKFANAWGFGLDLGLQYHTENGWQAGAMLRDATSTFNAWSYDLTPEVIKVFEDNNNEIPENSLELTAPQLLLSGAKEINFGKGFHGTFALDLSCTFDGKRNTLIKSNFMSIDPRFGMEFDYKKIVAIRAGIGNFQQELDFDDKKKTTLQVNLGVGINIKDIFTIDYAFTDIGDVSIAVYSHVFSLKVGIDSFKKKK
ncbi:PorV/PorQ family protein [Bacteroidales bacterium OttesenSCG-928-C03]|nr:PorV/PorQ family protein [Bacteroidales bacterium OttesenSCG-928-C03]MDL2326618.1 PorV/PorQ family protein [Bacteroidales bacterium OttesenSCG-928-A14]